MAKSKKKFKKRYVLGEGYLPCCSNPEGMVIRNRKTGEVMAVSFHGISEKKIKFPTSFKIKYRLVLERVI